MIIETKTKEVILILILIMFLSYVSLWGLEFIKGVLQKSYEEPKLERNFIFELLDKNMELKLDNYQLRQLVKKCQK